MMMMKNPVILATCVLVFSCLAVLASESSSGPRQCCFKLYKKRLPKDMVLSYQETDERCANKAVIFTMKSGASFCVNPDMPWVKNITQSKDWIHVKKADHSALEESLIQ